MTDSQAPPPRSDLVPNLPLAPAADALPASTEPALEPASASVADPATGPTVLLVDDNETNRLVGAAMLRRLGAVVTLAEDGADALARAREQRFDLVLMDRDMPGLDGLAATRALRERPDTRDLRIVALTGAGEHERQVCLAAGMDDFVTKPVTMATLAALLGQATHTHAA